MIRILFRNERGDITLKKRLIFFLSLLLLLVPIIANAVPSAGLLRGKSPVASSGATNLSYATDGNDSTFAGVSGYVKYQLSQPMLVTGYYAAINGLNINAVSIDFLDANGNQIASYAANYSTGGPNYQAVNVNNVSYVKVTIHNGISYSLYDLDVTGQPVPTIPNAPTGLSGIGGNKQVSLSWTSVSNATSYNVYRNGYKANASAVTTNSFTDTSGLSVGASYTYEVTAVNAAGESTKSSAITVTTQSPPTAPANLVVVSVTTGSVALSWDNSASATGYNVYKNGVLVNSSPYPSNNYTVVGLSASTMYQFQVSAVNSVGESAKSSVVKATTQDLPPFTLISPSDAKISPQGQITWTSPSSNPTGTTFNIYRNGTLIGNTSTSPFVDPSFNAYQTYTIAATYSGSTATPNPVAGSGIISGNAAGNWGFQASDIWSNSVNMVVSIAGFLVLILAVIFASDLRRFLGWLFERMRGRVKL